MEQIYKTFESQITDIENQIIDEYHKTHCRIHTIVGISEISAADIYAEYGGISNFNNPNQMLAFVGLDVSKHESGQENRNGHLVKHGSSHLRQIIMNVVDTFTLHNPVIYNYSQKKRNEGKHWRIIQTHIAKKLIRIIFHLENNQIDFDANLLR